MHIQWFYQLPIHFHFLMFIITIINLCHFCAILEQVEGMFFFLFVILLSATIVKFYMHYTNNCVLSTTAYLQVPPLGAVVMKYGEDRG
jgi:hypothetical protein